MILSVAYYAEPGLRAPTNPFSIRGELSTFFIRLREANMASTTEAPDPATMEAIRERLIQTGDWDRCVPFPLLPTPNSVSLCCSSISLRGDIRSRFRLLKALREKLGEAGWQDDVKDYAKGEVMSPPSLLLWEFR